MRRIVLFAVTAVILCIVYFLFAKVRDMVARHVNKGKPNEQCRVPPIGCLGTDVNSFILGFENAGYAQELLSLNKKLKHQ
ncbi:hypothetical protein [Sphaerospermopsis aphanizomenoides]|uniref:hypothetical protein n=1 Tax=Sphaerospermopsis aphanizomenoides TaxID=459663 RepID=UPI001F32E2D1|nr:hypothetical protein [Sphaerospermopsis aphanizomenoides]